MINANMYVKVDFDETGRKRIEDAYLTIKEIVAAVRKVGGQTSSMEDDLLLAQSYLQAFLDGTVW